VSDCGAMWSGEGARKSRGSAMSWLVLVLTVGAAQAATPFAKEYRSAVHTHPGNTLVDLDGSTTLDVGLEKPTSSSSGLNGGFKSESSVVLPGSGGFHKPRAKINVKYCFYYYNFKY